MPYRGDAARVKNVNLKGRGEGFGFCLCGTVLVFFDRALAQAMPPEFLSAVGTGKYVPHMSYIGMY